MAKNVKSLFFVLLFFNQLLSAQVSSLSSIEKQKTVEKALSNVSVTTIQFYLAGQNNQIQFTLSFSSPDMENADGFEMTFPTGVFPQVEGTSSSIGGINLNVPINGQTISWGRIPGGSLFGFLDPGTHNFTVSLDIDPSISGNITFEYTLHGDNWGGLPHIVSGTGLISHQPGGACSLGCPPAGIAEAETCGNIMNNGCDMAAPAFELVNPNTIICGTLWANNGSRDVDWFKIVLTEPARVFLHADAEASLDFGLVETQNPGNPSCQQLTGNVFPAGNAGPCAPASLDVGVLLAGTYWFWAGLSFFHNFPCTVNYTLEFEVAEIDCLPPLELNATNITQTSANLIWSPGSTETAWNVEVGHHGFTPGKSQNLNSFYGITSNNLALNNLDHSTPHQFYVQAVCNEKQTNSLWAGPYSFTTSCGVFTHSFVEGFESETAPPLCWTMRYANTSPPSGNYMIHTTSQAHSGLRSFRFSSILEGEPYDQYLRTPELNYTVPMELSFWYKRHTFGTETFRVGTSTNGSSWTWTNNITDADTFWKKFSMTLPAGTKYVEIHYRSVYRWYLFIDEFSIHEPGTCHAPIGLTANSITANSAALGWTETGQASTWNIEWGPEGFEQGNGTLLQTASNPRTITGLLPGTSYSFYVQAVCQGNNSSWAGPLSFATLCSAVSVFSENFDAVISPSLPICWGKAGTTGTVYTQSVNAFSPPNCLYLYSGSASNQAVIAMPEVVNINEGTHRLRFMARANISSGAIIEAGYLTNPSDPLSFVMLQAKTLSLNYEEYIVEPGILGSGDKRLAFRASHSPAYSLLVDNVIWEEISETPVFSVTPSIWNFGEINIGSQSAPKTFTITNTGSGVLWVAAPALENPEGFSLDYNAAHFPASLTANASVTFDVIFSPGHSGPYNARVSVDFNNGTEGFATINLSGTGVERPEGSICSNPIVISQLPLVNFQGNTELMGNDYSHKWIDPPSYFINGNDMVSRFSLNEPGYLSGTMTSSESWIGLFILEQCPNQYQPAQVLVSATGNGSSVSFFDLLLAEGEYFAIVSSYPPPQTITFNLNLLIDPLPAYPQPTGLTATSITTTSAVLGWTANGNENSWNVEYGLDGFEPGSGILLANVSNPYILDGLEPATAYAFYVQATGPGKLSNWAGPHAFSTLCNHFDIPFFENFDGVSTPEIPVCISVINQNEDQNQWQTVSFNASSPPNAMSINYNSAMDMDDWFFTPGLNLNAGVTYQVKFNYRAQASYYPEKLRVMWGLAPYPEEMTMGTIWDNPGISNTSYQEGSGLFTPSVSGVYYLGWHGYSNADMWRLFVDDISVEVATASFSLNLSVIIEGAFAPQNEVLMHTGINHLLPLSQPYGPELPYFGNNSPVWYYEGKESVAAMPSNVVDWVLIELRDAPEAELANIPLARKAALLLNTGQVVATNGQPLMFQQQISQGLFVVIYHRNHLAIMSSEALTENNGVYTWDFTSSEARAFYNNERSPLKQGLKNLGNDAYAMFGGDADGNGQIQVQDKNEVWNPQSGLSGYLPADFDMNGQVQVQDKNDIWNQNSGIGSAVPSGQKK